MSSDFLTIVEDVFKVIANRKRLEIILLLEERELNVTEMTTMLGLRQANLSQHLTLLRTQGLVEVRRHGRESFYRLSDDSIATAVRMVQDFLQRKHRVGELLSSEELFPIATDPVCGMRFSVSKAHSQLTHNGHAYYFCASGCADAFRTNVAMENGIEEAAAGVGGV